MKITLDQVNAIAGNKRYQSRRIAFCDFVNERGQGIASPHRMAQVLAQVMHECVGFKYVKEIWGPTRAQKRYEGRKDLGNVQKGDGKRFMGRLEIQTTGRYNYQKLTAWCKAKGIKAPDFEASPQELENPKWVGLGTVWYFATRVEVKFLDDGNNEMVTRRVNGGLNGYDDRLRYYDRAALVFLGYNATEIKRFQEKNGLIVDGVSGPQTRAAMHKALKAMPANSGTTPAAPVPKPVNFWAELFKVFSGILKGK